ncbi:MAG: iron-containing redox enzyme family protein [Actinomycetes bacterium]|jgi:hypothetical protein|uniref:Unannotated protein n=1 Tax=freshwater metagenome TaxID=449393 RepID=A0A6J6CJH6_9ZZZZ|nr:hypothetical protein [Actinomycetota bacterium]
MTIDRPSLRLRLKLAMARSALDTASHSLFQGPGARQTYVDYLLTMHGVVRASVPLLERAVEECARRPDDPLCRALMGYYEHHRLEEWGHDRWLLDDLAVVGLDADDVLRRIPPATVAALVGPQFYWVAHDHPVALMGYLAVLEGAPASAELLDRMEEATGWPRAAFSTIERHAALDHGHRDDIDEQIDLLPLSERDEALIGVSLFQTVTAATEMIQGLCRARDRHAAALVQR